MSLDVKPAIQITRILGFRVGYLQLIVLILLLTIVYVYLGMIKLVAMLLIYFAILYLVLKEVIDIKKIVIIFTITYITGIVFYISLHFPIFIVLLVLILVLLIFVLSYVLANNIAFLISTLYLPTLYFIISESEAWNQMFLNSLIIWAIFTITFFYFITSATLRLFNISIKNLFSKFFISWFYDDPALEEVLNKIGKTKEVDVDVIYLKIGDDIIYLLIPNFHFGPFGSIGSADAPAVFNQTMPNNLVFHGLNHHDRDVTSREQIEKLAVEIAKTPIGEFKKLRMKYKRYDKDNARADVIFTDDLTLVGLTRYPEVTEDVSSLGGELLRAELKTLVKNPIIFDQHNSDAKVIKYFSTDTQEFQEYLGVIRKIRPQDDLNPSKGKYTKIAYSTDIGLGSNGINILQLLAGGQKIAIVNIDGNGISSNSYVKIEQIAKKYGYNLILCTTDSHENNDVVGIVNDVDLSDFTINSIENVLKVDPSNDVYYNYKKFKFELNMLGEETSARLLTYLRMSVNFLVCTLVSAILINAYYILIL